MKRDRPDVRAHSHQWLVAKRAFYASINDSFVAYVTLRENPFFPETFPTLQQLREISELLAHRTNFFSDEKEREKRQRAETYDRQLSEYFRARYYVDWHDLLNRPQDSYTHAEIYELYPSALLETKVALRLNDDRSLILKAVPLLQQYIESDQDLQEIYNEIRVGFFLNELLYAYPRVLSYHFRSIVDWFVLFRPIESQSKQMMPYQYVVSEQTDTSLERFLEENPSWEALLCALFQVLHALETAWATHRFIHYDLHTGNVRMKRNQAQTRFFSRDYLYRRVYDVHQWYRLKASALVNHTVKLIDFGRSRLMAPEPSWAGDSSARTLIDHVDDGEKHHHRLLIAVEGFEMQGNPAENRAFDMRLLLWELITVMSPAYWRRIFDGRPHERTLFVALCDRVIDFGAMSRLAADEIFLNLLILNYLGGYDLSTEHFLSRDDELLRHRHEQYDFAVRELALLAIHTPANNGSSATSCLSDALFDDLLLGGADFEGEAAEGEVIMSSPEPLQSRAATYTALF